MDLMRQYVLDKARKTGRQQESKHRLAPDEHKGPEPEDVNFETIRTDRVNQKIFGQLVHQMYPDEAAGIYDRMHKGTLTPDDRKKFEAAQNEFPFEVSRRRKLAVTMESHITIDGIKAFSDVAPTSFGYYADLLKDRNRTMVLLRDYFADLAFNDDKEAAAVLEVFREMQALEESGEYKRALAQAGALAERGFTPEEFSVLEEGSLTPEEVGEHAKTRKERAEEIHKQYEAEGGFGNRWRIFTDNFASLLGFLGFSGPAARAARKEDETGLALDRTEATTFIKERVSSRATRVWRMWNRIALGWPKRHKVHEILRTVNKVEASKAFEQTESLLKEGAKLMGEAISKDKRFADELDEESRTSGGRQARAVVLDPVASEYAMKHWQTIKLNEKTYLAEFETWMNMESHGIEFADLSRKKDKVAAAELVAEEFTRVQTEDLAAKFGEGHWAQLFAASYREFADEMEPYLRDRLAPRPAPNP